jgi:YfiH family protein
MFNPDFFQSLKVNALQTTRIGGVSTKPYQSMNLGLFGEDPSAQENNKILANKLPHEAIFLQQVHGNKVVEYKQQPKTQGEYKADACFSSQKGVVCAVLSADCLPVLITDKASSIVAAVHCGWRGLHANILGETIKQLGVHPQDLLCWLGPCISYKPYKVDSEFRERFVKVDSELSHCFYQSQKGHWHADLKKIAVTQLQQLGVESIVQSPYCTFENKSLFYSYRRDKETGRMASLIWLT